MHKCYKKLISVNPCNGIHMSKCTGNPSTIIIECPAKNLERKKNKKHPITLESGKSNIVFTLKVIKGEDFRIVDVKIEIWDFQLVR